MNVIKKDELKFLLEKDIFKLLKEDEYIINYENPLKLINKSRFDLNAKLIYLNGYIDNKFNYNELYDSFINAFTLGSFIEPGNNNKNTLEKFRICFKDIYHSILNNGFDIKKSIIPLSKDGVILNGSHRLAVAIKCKTKVPCIKLNVKSPNYDYKFFRDRFVPEVFLDQCALNQVIFDKKVHIAIAWPSGVKSGFIFERFLPNIVYKKEINFTLNGIKNLVSLVYENEKWLGSIKNNFSGALIKAIACYADYPLTIFLFKPEKKSDLIKIKNKVRNIIGIKKHSLHINDLHSECIRICLSLLNENSIDLLNKTKLNSSSKKLFTHLRKFNNFIIKNNLDKDLIALDGSMVLSAYSLRDARDIDFLLHSSVISKVNLKSSSHIGIHNENVSSFYEKKIG